MTKMQTSQQGISFIKTHEGVRDQVYADPIGLLTGGVGHLLTFAERDDYKIGDPLTDTQIDEWLSSDLAQTELCIHSQVLPNLTQFQFDALVSFVFNLGCRALQKSQLLRFINAEQFDSASAEFAKWVYAGGKRLLGLVARRSDEASLFSTGDYFLAGTGPKEAHENAKAI